MWRTIGGLTVFTGVLIGMLIALGIIGMKM